MYCINPESDEPIFTIFDQIGRDDDRPNEPYVDGNLFAKELLYMDGEGKKRIQIWINSEGGSVKEGMSIISAMLQTKTKVDVLIVGIAYSISGVIALMGRKVEALDYSALMFHMAYNPDGTHDKGLDVINNSLITAISGRSGKSEEEVRMLMGRTTFYSAKEAFSEKLIDAIIKCEDSNTPRKSYETKALHEYGVKYLNKFLPTNKINPMKEVAIELDLNEEASVGAMRSAVATIKAKNKSYEESENAWKTEKEKMQGTIDSLNKKVGEMETANKEASEASAAKAKDAFKVGAKAKVEATVLNKGLKLEAKVVADYVDLAGETQESLDKVVGMIEAIPSVKKAANVLDAKNKQKENDETGIPEIPAVAANEDGSLVAGDTSRMVQGINGFDMRRYQNRNR